MKILKDIVDKGLTREYTKNIIVQGVNQIITQNPH